MGVAVTDRFDERRIEAGREDYKKMERALYYDERRPEVYGVVI